MSYKQEIYEWLDSHSSEVEHLGYTEQARLAIQDGVTDAAERTARRHVSNWWDARDGEGVKDNETCGGSQESAGQTTGSKADSKTEWKHRGRGESGDWYKLDPDEEEYIFSWGRKYPYLWVQKACEVYSKHGGNFTTSQTCTYLARHFDVDMPQHEMARIFTAIGFTHQDQPFAPHRKADTTEEEAAEEWSYRKIASIERKFRKKYPKALERELRKEREKSLEAEQLARSILEEYEDTFERLRPHIDREPIALPSADNVEPHTPVFVLGDWHCGKVVDMDQNVYNKDVFWQRLARWEQETTQYFAVDCRRPVKKIVVLVVGDMLDSVLANMHDQQADGQDLRGTEQATTAAVAMARAILHLSSLVDVPVEVHATNGNHDRVSGDRSFDRTRFAGTMTNILAKMCCLFDSRVHWNIYESVVEPIDVDGTRVLITHGDRSPSDLRKLLWPYRDASKFAVVSGHLHSMEITEDLDVFYIRNGAMVGPTDYSINRLGKASPASQAVFSIREDGPRPAHYIPLQ